MDLRALGVSLWQPVPYAEAELLVGELLGEPGSRLRAAVQAAQDAEPLVTSEQAQAITPALMPLLKTR